MRAVCTSAEKGGKKRKQVLEASNYYMGRRGDAKGGKG